MGKLNINKSTHEAAKDYVDVVHKTDGIVPIVTDPPKNKEVKLDSWSNFFVGMGGKKDKYKYTEIGDYTLLDDSTLGAMDMSDGLGSG